MLGPSAGQITELTYAELHRAVFRIAAGLAGRYPAGERALLLMPNSVELVQSFLGCLRAGLIAVPVPVSASGRLNKGAERLTGLIADCMPVAGLATSEALSTADPKLLDALDPVAIDQLPRPSGPVPDRTERIAYLQYSSGSTGRPKAVCNTHRTLLNQAELLGQSWPGPESLHFVGWLPIYHDMGMILQLLTPLLNGGTVTLMRPAAFAADPASWLRAVSAYRGGWIAGPDFAFERCCHAFTAAEADELDLSCLRYTTNGAEPIRPGTLTRFHDHFAAAGLPATAVSPAYGLAEAGLAVSISRRPRGWVVNHYDQAALRDGTAVPVQDGAGRALVSCGNYLFGWRIAIVDPDRGTALDDRRVGEVWVAGDGLPDGYWRRPEETALTFGARLDDGSGPYLRTGDLGFLDGGELFVCGRRKDVVIIHGTNHHPNDIEATIERAVAESAVAGVCATQVTEDGRLLVFVEVDQGVPAERYAGVVAEIRVAVLAGHELAVDEVVLVRRPSLPKTTSGKIRRSTTAAGYLAGKLPALYADRLGPTADTRAIPADTPVVAVLQETLRQVLGVTAVGLDTGFASLGLNSLHANRWAHELSQRLDVQVPVTLLYANPTLRQLATALSGRDSALEPLKCTLGPPEPRKCEPVAVIGVGLRLPGGLRTLDALAGFLLDAGGAVGPPPPARASDGVPLSLPGAYLESVDTFDAELFGVDGTEAAAMDPQQRLLLEVAWHAIEDAGRPAGSLRGARVGVFVGQGHADYAALPLRAGHPEWVRAFHATGTSMSAAAGRIANHFGFGGPALVVDTACSASLVAIDTALRHLADGSCELALAGGVNLALSPETERSLDSAGMLSPRGRCATLSADADGYGRGEGAALLVLKPLAAANRDGDRVLAVLSGSAVAHDGASSGLTVPNPRAQAVVVRAALANAGLAPGDVDGVELHGTGTPLGDPIELAALAEVHHGRSAPLLVGSVKTNLGHLEAAAGVAGVLRAIVALHRQCWPGSPTLTKPNPRLAELGLPYRMTAATEPAPLDRPLRRVGVSSFGFTGTIAHLVVERAPEPTEASTPAVPWSGWVPVAAANEPALRERAAALANALADRPLEEQARTLASWRRQREHRLPWRTVVTADDPPALLAVLADPPTPHHSPGTPAVVLQQCPDDHADQLIRLINGLRDWLPSPLQPPADLAPEAQLVAVLTTLGAAPDITKPPACPPQFHACPQESHGDTVVLSVVPSPGAVLLDPADGGRAGLAEVYRRGVPLDWSVLDPPLPPDPALQIGRAHV